MDFWRAAEVLGKRKWLILLSVVVTTALTYAATRLIGTKWQATVQLASAQNTALNTAPERDPGQQRAKAMAAIYTAQIKSANVLVPVFNQLHINPDADLLSNIEIDPTSLHLFGLAVTDRNPQRAAVIANALAEKFVDVTKHQGSTDSKKNIDLLRKQLSQIDTSLDKARSRLNNFRVQHRIIEDLKNSLALAVGRLKEVQHNRDQAAELLAAAQARLAQQQGTLQGISSTVKGTTEAAASPYAKDLQQSLNDIKKQLVLLQQKYKDTDPRVKDLLQKEAALTTELKKENSRTAKQAFQQPNQAYVDKQQAIDTAKQEVASRNAQLNTLNSEVSTAQAEVDSYKGLDGPLNTLQSELAYWSDMHKKLTTNLNNAMLGASVQQGPLQILSRVNDYNPPVNTTLSRTLKLIVLGALCALIGSSALIVAFDSVDRRLRTVKEAEGILPTRVLAAIPQPMGNVTYSTLARATEVHPLSLHSEAYRFLGQHLLNAHRRMRTFMVLSTKAEQGSTSTVTNLGITLAQAGHRVIIVDANVRTPEIHQVFHLQNEYGYMDLLQKPDAGSFEKALHTTSVANLRVITSGQTPDNPWELFRSENLTDVANRLRDMADYVLYDTPSALLFTDAMNLAPVVDAAFLCVRALEQPTGAERRLVELLEQANVPVLGSVLTDVPASVLEGYNNYQHYYAPTLNAVPLVATGEGGDVHIATTVASRIEEPKNGHDGNGNNGNTISRQ